MKVFGNEGLTNETPVSTAELDKVHVPDPTQTGTAPRSRNKTCGYNIYYREPKTHKRINRFDEMWKKGSANSAVRLLLLFTKYMYSGETFNSIWWKNCL